MSKTIASMTGREVLDALRADTQLSRVARIFSESWAEIDQASRQRKPPGPVEVRRMELQAANKICELFGAGLPSPIKEIPYNPAWTHGEIGADEAALMEANGWRMRPDGSYFKPGS